MGHSVALNVDKVRPSSTSSAWFTQGYACAVATMIRIDGCNSTMSDELFKAGVGSIENCKRANIDPYDMEILEKYYK